VTLAISSDTEDLGYDKLKFVTPYIEMVDAKTLKELDKLKPMDIADIFYHNKSKTAQLQTKLYEEDYQKSLGGKIRKKTWNFLQKVMEDIFKTSQACPER